MTLVEALDAAPVSHGVQRAFGTDNYRNEVTFIARRATETGRVTVTGYLADPSKPTWSKPVRIWRQSVEGFERSVTWKPTGTAS